MRRLLLCCAAAVAFSAHAQDYPTRPIRVVVASAPGGAIDVVARVVAQQLADTWKQPVPVENRPAAGAVIGVETVARAAPDGYTLLFVSLNPFAISPNVFAKLSYDPDRSLAPIVLATRDAMVIVAGEKAPFANLRALIQEAKARPGALQWGSPGLATSNHLAGEWFAAETGLAVQHIPYKGGPAAANAILSGEVSFGVLALVQALPLAKKSDIKILGVTTVRRSPLAPEWPTVAELAIPGFDAAVHSAMFAPWGTPAAIVTKLNAEVNRILTLPDVRERFAGLGVEPLGSTPEGLTATILAQRAKIKEIVTRGNIKVQ